MAGACAVARAPFLQLASAQAAAAANRIRPACAGREPGRRVVLGRGPPILESRMLMLELLANSTRDSTPAWTLRGTP